MHIFAMVTFVGAIDIMETDFLLDEVFGERLLISQKADKSELSSNVRVNARYQNRIEIEHKIETLRP